MKILFSLILCIFFLNTCGKKVEPQYQGKNNLIIKINS